VDLPQVFAKRALMGQVRRGEHTECFHVLDDRGQAQRRIAHPTRGQRQVGRGVVRVEATGDRRIADAHLREGAVLRAQSPEGGPVDPGSQDLLAPVGNVTRTHPQRDVRGASTAHSDRGHTEGALP
jgi:hypothetical protein